MITYSNIKAYNQIWSPMGRYPMIDNTIFETYNEALAFATTNAVAVVGNIVTVTSDPDASKNGAYILICDGELTSASQPTGLKKLGSDIDLSNYVTKDQLTSIYTYKGSKATFAELPVVDVVVGDVWNVEEAYENHPAGTNWVWDGENWDALAGSVDLSGYALKADVEASVATLTGNVATNTGAIAEINTALTNKVEKVEGSSLITAEKLELIDTNAGEIAALKEVDASLDTRLKVVEGAFKGEGGEIDLGDLTTQITDHGTRIVALEGANTTNQTNITTLQGEVSGHGSRLTAIETLNTEQSNQISGLITRVENVEKHGEAITKLNTLVNGHTDLISGLRTDLNSEISNRETAVNDAKTHAETKAGEALEAAKTYVGEELAKLNYDAAGSAAAVEGKLNEEIARAKAAEKANTDAIVVERGRIEALLTSEGVQDAVESFKELQVWIENHEGGAADILAAANKAQEEVDALELVVSAMDEAYKAADLVVLGDAKKYTDDKFVTLGSAAYEDKSAFATAAQGALAETAAQQDNTYTKTEVDSKISDAFSWINV